MGDIGLSVSLGIATAIGFIVGLIINWILSVKFVYRAVRDKEEASSKKSFLVFTLIGACGLVISSIGVPALAFILPEIELFNRTMVFGILWKEWIARIALTCIVLIWNYIGRKIFIFKS